MTIDQWLQRQGKTRADLASTVGVSKSTVESWAMGRRRPQFHHMVEVAKATEGAVRRLEDWAPELATDRERGWPIMEDPASPDAPMEGQISILGAMAAKGAP